VGGVFEKAYGARQAGIRTLIIPKENETDIPKGHLGLDIHAVSTAAEAFQLIFVDPPQIQQTTLAVENEGNIS
jgi:ATP-dependent Lon protease